MFLLKAELAKKTNLEKRLRRNVFSRLLAKWNQNIFQSLSLKGLGWEEGGEQEACRLQHTRVLHSAAGSSLGAHRSPLRLSLGQLIFKLHWFPNAREDFGRVKQRGAEVAGQNWHLTHLPDSWVWENLAEASLLVGPHPRAAGSSACVLAHHRRQGAHRAGYFAPGAPYLKPSSKEEMSLFAFSHWSMEECFSLHYTECSGLPQACSWARRALKTPVSFPFKCTLQTNLFGGFQKR